MDTRAKKVKKDFRIELRIDSATAEEIKKRSGGNVSRFFREAVEEKLKKE